MAIVEMINSLDGLYSLTVIKTSNEYLKPDNYAPMTNQLASHDRYMVSVLRADINERILSSLLLHKLKSSGAFSLISPREVENQTSRENENIVISISEIFIASNSYKASSGSNKSTT